MKIYDDILWDSNLEFSFSPQKIYEWYKILYRSFWDSKIFKQRILSHILDLDIASDISEKICWIFQIPEVEHLVFHYWEDIETRRIKFYISLYGLSLKESWKIISQIKKILGVQEYILEKDFLAFDCLWFDICSDKITLKVYELLRDYKNYSHILPQEIHIKNIKEFWVLKSENRKKYFFRLKQPIPVKLWDSSSLQKIAEIQKTLPHTYSFKWEISYYCIESEREEIYVI